jgi:SAM-dependent methyltransferase
MDELIRSNQALWDELTEVNAQSEMYKLEKFLRDPGARAARLGHLELAELGPVAGKSLLHLQCHFGMDTLALEHLGAQTTGVDFSEKAIALAENIRDQIGGKARFLCCNLYDLPAHLEGGFNIVFTSNGVLCWLPDLAEWGRIIARYLKPGGTFYLLEYHPFANIFENAKNSSELTVTYPYFDKKAVRFDNDTAYADPGHTLQNPSHEWFYSLSEVVNSLINAGLEIEFIHEFPFCNYAKFPCMRKNDAGWWVLEGKYAEIPLMFSIRAKQKA